MYFFWLMDKLATRKKIGKKLRELRIKAGYGSYESFAYDKGLTRQTVGRAEQGENLKIDTLLDLLINLQVSPEDFFSGNKISSFIRL
jgi:transcriptional regulator with XRE-family HTH domain